LDIIKLIPRLKSVLRPFSLAQKRIGLVPTMGALHEGHLALVRQSKSENDITIVSIFVNPTQFNSAEDLEKYPRSLDTDLALLTDEGVDVVFTPSAEEMYPGSLGLSIQFSSLDDILEGKFRPNHFSGVAIVLAKLFHLVKPNSAYFGQKDLQQVSIVRRLASDLFFDLNIVMVSTVRENDGLALSSRNRRLNIEERKEAVILYRCLLFAKAELLNGASWFDVKETATSMMAQQSLVCLEYLEMVNCNNFTLSYKINPQLSQAICIAAYVGDIRLIDNIVLS
jgi:pantoate--beta-alanine ligase